jgi:hypothetical protein
MQRQSKVQFQKESSLAEFFDNWLRRAKARLLNNSLVGNEFFNID